MPSAHVQKEGTTQTEESSQNNCSVRYNNDGKQTKSMHRGAVEMKYHQGLVTDSAIRSTLAHPNTLVRALAPQSRREAAGDCTRRLLRAQTPRARAGGNAVLFWSGSCFLSWDAETGYKQQQAWISNQSRLLQQEMKTSKKSPLSQIDACTQAYFSPISKPSSDLNRSRINLLLLAESVHTFLRQRDRWGKVWLHLDMCAGLPWAAAGWLILDELSALWREGQRWNKCSCAHGCLQSPLFFHLPNHPGCFGKRIPSASLICLAALLLVQIYPNF